jgi:hypothetical protein
MHLGFKNVPFVPHNLMAVHGGPVPVLKFQMAHRLTQLMFSGSKKKEQRYIYIYIYIYMSECS